MPVKPNGPSKISLACNLGWKAFLCSQNFIFKKKLKKKNSSNFEPLLPSSDRQGMLSYAYLISFGTQRGRQELLCVWLPLWNRFWTCS